MCVLVGSGDHWHVSGCQPWLSYTSHKITVSNAKPISATYIHETRPTSGSSSISILGVNQVLSTFMSEIHRYTV